MFRFCRNVLATDLSWPTYQQTIEMNARRTGNRVTTIPLRECILEHQWTVNDVAKYIADHFLTLDCDGLFLPAVDHLGIRLPIRSIVERIRERSELRFCLIDAAQAFCHLPLEECLEFADFIVTGSHKWMGAYLPTGIGLFGQRRSRPLFEHRIKHQRRAGVIGDPLLHFTEQLTHGEIDGASETANLTPVFACAGAAFDSLAISVDQSADNIRGIDAKLRAAPSPSGAWQPLRPAEGMRSQIVLCKATDRDAQGERPDVNRNSWLSAGCVVSAFADGIVRLSFGRS